MAYALSVDTKIDDLELL